MSLTATSHVLDQKVRHDIWDDILRNGYAESTIDSRFLAKEVPILCAGITQMTDTKDRERFNSVVLTVDEMGWEHNSGLVRRSDDEQKWFFHFYGSATEQHLRAAGAPVDDYAAFFASLHRMNAAAKARALDLARIYDARFPCPSGPLAPRIERSLCLTRILRYLHRGHSADNDATVHLDRNAITVHWVSTKPGLVIFDPLGEKHRAAELAHDRIAVFTGKKFAAATRGEHGFGTPHGVKDLERHTRFGEDRFAIITFVHLALSDGDVQWLKSHKAEMDALEQSCVI